MKYKTCSSTIVIALLIAAAIPAWAASPDPEANKALVHRVIDEVLNQGQLDLADDVVAEGEGSFGPDWFRTTYRVRRTAFPDLRYEIEETVAEGDMVVVRFSAVGTPNGPVVIAPSEEPVRVSGVAFFQVRGGKIVDGWELTDMLGLMRETGYTIQAPQPPDRGTGD